MSKLDVEDLNGDSSNARKEVRDSLSTQESQYASFPEGGLRAWVTVLGSFLGLVNCFGMVNSTSAVESYIAEHQLSNESASSVGWIFSIYFFASLFFGIFTGHFFDVYGPRIPLALGTVLCFAGYFATGNCTSLGQFIVAFGITSGIGCALQIPALFGCISHYFHRKRGLAMGFASVGGSVGGAVFPVMLRRLYDTVGFVWAMRISAFVTAALNLAALAFITPRFPPSGKKMSVREFFSNTVALRSLLDPKFAFCALGVTFGEVFLTTSMTYYGSYSLHVGYSQNTAYLLITVVNASGVVARVSAGYLSDKLGKFNVDIAMTFFAALFCLVVWLPFGSKLAGMYTFAVLYGIASSAVLSLTPLCISLISRVEDFGKNYSTCNLCISIGCLVGVPISGIFIGSNPSKQDYDHFVVFVGALGFAGAFCLFISRCFAVGLRFGVY